MGQKRRGSASFNQPSQNNSSEPMVLSVNIDEAGGKGMYFTPNGGVNTVYGAAGTVADQTGWLTSVPGTLNNFNGLIDTATASPGETFTVYKNNVITDLSFTIPAAGTIGSDLTHQVPCAAGDYISILYVGTSHGGFTNGSLGLQFVPS